MIIVREIANPATMSSRTDSNSPLLIALVLIVTFPLWFGLGMGLFGLIVGLMGAAVGLIAGFFGLIVGLIALPFKLLFGWGDWGWGCDIFPSFHFGRSFMMVIVIIIAALIVKNRRTA